METLSKDKGLQFFATWFRSNNWRLVNLAGGDAEKIELTLLLEHFFTSFAVHTDEMFFLNHVKYLRCIFFLFCNLIFFKKIMYT